MNGQQLVDLTVAKVVPITDAEQVANVNTDFVLAAVNQAYHEVERAALWKFSEAETTFSSVPGTQTYAEATIAADLATILHVWDQTAREELDFWDERQRHHDTGGRTGVPYAWARWAGNLLLHPSPSVARTYTVRYYAQWDDIELGTDPVFPSTYHDILADKAAYTLALRQPAPGDRFLPNSKAEPFLRDFLAELDRMVNDPRIAVTQDEVPNHDWEDYVHSGQDW